MNHYVSAILNVDHARAAGFCRRVFFVDHPSIKPPNVAPAINFASSIHSNSLAVLNNDEILIFVFGYLRIVLYSVTGDQLSPYLQCNIDESLKYDWHGVVCLTWH